MSSISTLLSLNTRLWCLHSIMLGKCGFLCWIFDCFSILYFLFASQWLAVLSSTLWPYLSSTIYVINFDILLVVWQPRPVARFFFLVSCCYLFHLASYELNLFSLGSYGSILNFLPCLCVDPLVRYLHFWEHMSWSFYSKKKGLESVATFYQWLAVFGLYLRSNFEPWLLFSCFYIYYES